MSYYLFGHREVSIMFKFLFKHFILHKQNVFTTTAEIHQVSTGSNAATEKHSIGHTNDFHREYTYTPLDEINDAPLIKEDEVHTVV